MSSRPLITLTPDEAKAAMEVGGRRFKNSEANGYLQSDGSKSSNGLVNHQRGAAAEIAAANFLGIPWTATVDGYQTVPDLDGVEVRSTGKERPYLRVKVADKESKQDRAFMAITRLGNCRFRIEGWIEASEAMRNEFFVEVDPDSHKPEWHIPFDRLYPPETLKARQSREKPQDHP